MLISSSAKAPDLWFHLHRNKYILNFDQNIFTYENS